MNTAGETDDLDEIMNELRDNVTEKQSRQLRSREPIGIPIHDTNPERANDKSFQRVVKLHCTKCPMTWNAIYEGPFPKHRSDLLCYKCSR